MVTGAVQKSKINFLVSCASLTMNRYSKALKKKNLFKDSESRNFDIFCFSLMINSHLDLDSMSKFIGFI